MLGVNVSQTVFDTLTQVVARLHDLLPDQLDRHGRNRLLDAYVQHVFDHPLVSTDKTKLSSNTSTGSLRGRSTSNPGTV